MRQPARSRAPFSSATRRIVVSHASRSCGTRPPHRPCACRNSPSNEASGPGSMRCSPAGPACSGGPWPAADAGDPERPLPERSPAARGHARAPGRFRAPREVARPSCRWRRSTSRAERRSGSATGPPASPPSTCWRRRRFRLSTPRSSWRGGCSAAPGSRTTCPVDRAFELEPASEMLCIAVDLFGARHPARVARRHGRARAGPRLCEPGRRVDRGDRARTSLRGAWRRGRPARRSRARRVPRPGGAARSEDARLLARVDPRTGGAGLRDMAAMLDRVAAARWDQPLLVLE